MAIAHLSVKVGKAGKGAAHAAYISRTGQYARRLEKGERLIASEVGNMPDWARDNPLSFWEAADAFERKNGSVYREMEIALPRELDTEQQIALVRDWVQQELGGKHVYQWAIHEPKAADGKTQPHVHLMFSERTLDGIERGPDQFFKRYNAKNPERGGCKKANTGLDNETRKEQLKALRERWQVACNLALERAGKDARIDMRSYADQGLDIQPEKKMPPSQWRQESRRAEIIDFRKARAELADARKEVARLIPDTGAEIIALHRRDRTAPETAQTPETPQTTATLKATETAPHKTFERLAEPRTLLAHHRNGKPLVRDYGDRITVTRRALLGTSRRAEETRDKAVQTALLAARDRFGEPLRFDGDRHFATATVKQAVALGIQLEPADDQGRQIYAAALEQQRREQERVRQFEAFNRAASKQRGQRKDRGLER